MKRWYLVFLISCMSCGDKTADTASTGNTKAAERRTEAPKKINKTPEVYSNARFKDVRVEQTGEHQFRVTGKAQVFEAAFSWVVEDGHEELAQGHEMTDAGAPEFGNFKFDITVQKKRTNSTIHLILFEASPKDGSRQYELPILLD